MPLVRTVERQMRELEGFDVKFLRSNGQDVRGDLKGIPQYPFMRALKGSKTVSAWKRQRFSQRYPGFDCVVLDVDGRPVYGMTKLTNLRDTYLEG